MYSIGDTVPDFSVKSTDGGDFGLYKELENGPILLNFYVGDFGINCTTYLSKFIESYDRLKDAGIRLVPINPDSLDSHKMWKDRLGAPFDFLWDEGQKISKDYEAIVGPGHMVSGFTNREFYLIGKDRKVKYVWKSPVPKVLPDVDEMIDAVIKEIKN